MDARQSTRLTQIFIPVDQSDPCPRWQVAAQNAGVPGSNTDWHCEHVDGGEYRVSLPDQRPTRRWIDPELGFPVKQQAADGTTLTVEHIRIEAQPASLFVIPAGYHELNPQALIDRIKHSDVWVDPPK
jgi:hypothetical protein